MLGVCVLVLGAAAGPAAARTAVSATFTLPPPTGYVALGDSYAAGPLIPLQTGVPAGCLRSNRNYPAVVARTAGIAEVRDVTCSGATTDDLAGSQTLPTGTNSPQFDALDEDTELVTLTMGGNDIGFATIIGECAARSPKRPGGAACRDFYTAGGTDQLAARIDATAPKIAAALATIEERSPGARVLVVGYPAILPDTGPGCFPVVPFTAGDVSYLRETQKRLNAMLADEADEAGVDYVDTYTPTIGHDVCTLPGTKWVEGLVPTAPAAPVHPNALGMAAMARAVVAELADESALVPGA